MARIRWHGTIFSATPIEQLPNGDWIMEAAEHGARFTIGTRILVTKNEILEMAAAEQPEPPADSAKALQAAMDAERETLPSVESLLAAAQPKLPKPGDD